MAVIADTSPLNYLILIEAEEVLARLYQSVLVPDPVWQELQHPHTPQIVAEWAAHIPSWIEVVSSKSFPIELELRDLDPGESSAIALAKAHQPQALLLMDDWKGRQQAECRGISQLWGHWGSCGMRRPKDCSTCRLLWLDCARPASALPSIC